MTVAGGIGLDHEDEFPAAQQPACNAQRALQLGLPAGTANPS
jgi:hypothetical protein